MDSLPLDCLLYICDYLPLRDVYCLVGRFKYFPSNDPFGRKLYLLLLERTGEECYDVVCRFDDPALLSTVTTYHPKILIDVRKLFLTERSNLLETLLGTEFSRYIFDTYITFLSEGISVSFDILGRIKQDPYQFVFWIYNRYSEVRWKYGIILDKFIDKYGVDISREVFSAYRKMLPPKIGEMLMDYENLPILEPGLARRIRKEFLRKSVKEDKILSILYSRSIEAPERIVRKGERDRAKLLDLLCYSFGGTMFRRSYET